MEKSDYSLLMDLDNLWTAFRNGSLTTEEDGLSVLGAAFASRMMAFDEEIGA